MKMKEWYKKHGKWIWWVASAGVAIGYLGIWIKAFWVLWLGIVLALPLFVVVLPMCLLGLAAVITRPLWHPFYWLFLKRSGVPFQQGDMVRVRWGTHRGKLVRVYDVWKERDQVRVDLGESAKATVTDVFWFGSVKKERGANNTPDGICQPADGLPKPSV